MATRLSSLILLLSGCPGTEPKPEPVEAGDSEPAETVEDCVYYQDRDGDGYGGDTSREVSCGDGPIRWVLVTGDCDDSLASCAPGLDEVCDVLDNDCDGETDEGFEVATLYRDDDADGFGDPATETWGCAEAEGYVQDNTDCDPSESDTWPGAPERCDQEDNDCDGAVDEYLPKSTYYYDADGDGYGESRTTTELCGPSGNWVAESNDCAVNDTNIHPEQVEDCGNGRDDDCDGLLDCEDDACAGVRTCGEIACSDGLDDDGDGAVDCTDDECWGASACPGVVVSWVTEAAGATGAESWGRGAMWDFCDSERWSSAISWASTFWDATEVVGSARLYRPGASVGLACGWGAAQARWRRTVHIERHISSTVESTITRTGTDSFRDGFWISGDCGLVGSGLVGSGFLPAPRELTAKSSGWYNFGHVLSSNMWRDGWNSWTTCRGTANAGQDSDWYWYATDWREDGVGSGDNHVVTSASYSPP